MKDHYRPNGLNIKQAASYLGVSFTTMKRLKEAGDIRYSKIRGRIVFRPSRLEEYMLRQEVER